MISLQDLFFSLLESDAVTPQFLVADRRWSALMEKVPKETAEPLEKAVLKIESECFAMGFREAMMLFVSGGR